jgi:hypothetical protein
MYTDWATRVVANYSAKNGFLSPDSAQITGFSGEEEGGGGAEFFLFFWLVIHVRELRSERQVKCGGLKLMDLVRWGERLTHHPFKQRLCRVCNV